MNGCCISIGIRCCTVGRLGECQSDGSAERVEPACTPMSFAAVGNATPTLPKVGATLKTANRTTPPVAPTPHTARARSSHTLWSENHALDLRRLFRPGRHIFQVGSDLCHGQNAYVRTNPCNFPDYDPSHRAGLAKNFLQKRPVSWQLWLKMTRSFARLSFNQ